MSAPDDTARVVVVLASYNRKSATLRCLDSLQHAGHPASHLRTILFDDASPDGTSEAVRTAYPEMLVIDGDGGQFWCGGMRRAMAAASEQPHDFLLWLNDDVEVAPGFLAGLLTAHRQASTLSPGPHVIVGAVVDPHTGEVTYSGLRRTSRIHPAKLKRVPCNPDRLEPCDSLNGNCVLFPATLVRKVGTIGAHYAHQLGDVDYGYRCAQAGARLWVAPAIVGTCARNDTALQWVNPRLSLSERLRIFNTPHGLPLRPWIHFMWRFGGPLGVAMLFAGYAKWLGKSLAQTVNRPPA